MLVAVDPAPGRAQAASTQRCRVATRQADDAPACAGPPDPALDGKQQLAQSWLPGANLGGLAQDQTVSREGLNTRSAMGNTTVPGRSARAWVRSKARRMSRISMRWA